MQDANELNGVRVAGMLTDGHVAQADYHLKAAHARASSGSVYSSTRTVATSFTVVDENAPPSQRYNRVTISHAHAQVQDTMQTRRIYPAQARSAQAQGQHLNGAVLDRTGRHTAPGSNGKVLSRR